MGIKHKIRVTPKIVAKTLFLLFFCYEIFAEVVERTLGSYFITPIYCFIFFSLLFLAMYVHSGKDSLIIPVLVYFSIFLAFLLTITFHPEYDSWFSHSVYGIVPSFLVPRNGIWAFIIIWLIQDDDDLYLLVKDSAWIMFVFYVIQFILASGRGYWVVRDLDGSVRNELYHLEYGYNMLFPVALFGGEYFIHSQKKYIVPYAIGTIIIFISGSRGSIIWTVIMFLLFLPLKWKNMEKRRRIRLVFILVLLSIVIITVYLNYQAILLALSTLLSKKGISSRTLYSLLEGSFSDGNGREQIYSLAIDLIKSGGLFGHGIYGDRFIIGNYYRWGYSHNIFLELFVSFGYLGGTLISGAIVLGIMKLYKNCNTLSKQIVFSTFLISSCKLLLSNSFWYNAAFWAILSLMFKWNRTHKYKISVNAIVKKGRA